MNKLIIRILIGLIGLFFFNSCSQRDALSEKAFEGYYHPIEYIVIRFHPNSEVSARICCTEVVGSFHVEVYGHYEYRHPFINIAWEKMEDNGYHYCEGLINNPDSLRINDALNTLYLYEDSERYVLSSFPSSKFIKNIALGILFLIILGLLYVNWRIKKKRLIHR